MLTIREARESDARSMARVHVDVSRSAFQGFLPDAVLAGLSYESLEANWQKDFSNAGHSGHHSYWVAEAKSGNIVGFAAAGFGSNLAGVFDSEILAIYVNERQQRKGIGRDLFTHMVDGLIERHKYSLVAWTLSGTQSCPFFEAVGGSALGQCQLAVQSAMVMQSGFGWPALRRRLTP